MQIKKVASTSIPADANEADYANWPSLSTQTDNFRKAFAVVGMLVATGAIEVDFDAPGGWHSRFECLVLDIAQTLDTLES